MAIGTYHSLAEWVGTMVLHAELDAIVVVLVVALVVVVARMV